jgi:lysophospholipase L1-like esterase
MKTFKLSIFFVAIALCLTVRVTAQDWAGLGTYQAENAKLAPPVKGENRVVFMGNSITEFWAKLHPEFFAGKPYVDRGISGQTSPQMLLRFRQDVVDLKPAAVIILAGINDIAGNTGPSTLEMIMNNIISMAQLAKANHITPILCSVLPANDFPWNPGTEPADKVITLNKMIRQYADENGIIYVDYFTPMVDDKKGLKAEYSDDGVHPNVAGYQVMEPLAEKAIEKAVKMNR